MRCLILLATVTLACSATSEDPAPAMAAADAGSGGDTGASDAVADTAPEPEDIEPIEDVEPASPEIQLPFDLGPNADLTERTPDIKDRVPPAFDDCPTLGISPNWSGTFEGIVTYDLADTAGGPRKQGLFFVGGDLAFEIKCLDKKLLVAGQLIGTANAAGEAGEHPFAANIIGDFDYLQRTIRADLRDGEVFLFKVIRVFFEGSFDGAVTPQNTFEGVWDAVHVGNDVGVEGTAGGKGTWQAHPDF